MLRHLATVYDLISASGWFGLSNLNFASTTTGPIPPVSFNSSFSLLTNANIFGLRQLLATSAEFTWLAEFHRMPCCLVRLAYLRLIWPVLMQHYWTGRSVQVARKFGLSY
ncbi:unnamed protein product [Protopolystoma xenopodis]|uniref:Uncharacterized protein n=1 Tax=Protopolystoma xenopodis TaxID=117903 RepID=A0A3S5C7N8_9PLAT|nr:unnamed protein product [Protopolystoma xenopodis]